MIDFSGELVNKIWLNDLGAKNNMALSASYYNGTQSIPELGVSRKDGRVKSNARTNWIKYIVDFHTGFNLSNRVNYTTYNKTLLEKFANYYEQNNLHANDMEDFSNAVLYGYGVEVVTFDGDRLRFKSFDPRNWVFVDDSQNNMVAAIYKTTIDKYTYFAGALVDTAFDLYYVYTASDFITYRAINGTLTEIDRIPNRIGFIPVIRYKVSKGNDSFITSALRSQCDIYDVISNSLADEIKYSVDSFLHLKGMTLDPLLETDDNGITNLQHIQSLRLWATPKDTEIKPIERNIDVEKFRYDLFTRSVAVHLMGCVPDTVSERINGNGALTNLSGIALKILYSRASQKSAEFRNYFIVGLRQRLDIINLYSRLIGSIPTATDVAIRIQPNMPQNYTEYMQYAPSMLGILPQQEILRQLPFIDDPDRVYRELLIEQSKNNSADMATN